MTKISMSGSSGIKVRRELGPVVAKIESMSSEGKIYEIREASDGSHLYCCPAWRFQKLPPDMRTCKHIKIFTGDRSFAAPRKVARLGR